MIECGHRLPQRARTNVTFAAQVADVRRMPQYAAGAAVLVMRSDRCWHAARVLGVDHGAALLTVALGDGSMRRVPFGLVRAA